MSLFDDYESAAMADHMPYWLGDDVTVYEPNGSVAGTVKAWTVYDDLSQLELTDDSISTKHSVVRMNVTLPASVGADVDWLINTPDGRYWRVIEFTGKGPNAVTFICEQYLRWNSQAARLYGGQP